MESMNMRGLVEFLMLMKRWFQLIVFLFGISQTFEKTVWPNGT